MVAKARGDDEPIVDWGGDCLAEELLAQVLMMGVVDPGYLLQQGETECWRGGVRALDWRVWAAEQVEEVESGIVKTVVAPILFDLRERRKVCDQICAQDGRHADIIA